MKMFMVECLLFNDQLMVSWQIGVGVNGMVVNKCVIYSVGFFNGNGVNNGVNDNDNFMYVGCVVVMVWICGVDCFVFGFNGFMLSDMGIFVFGSIFIGWCIGYGVDSQLMLGWFDVNGEYFNLFVDCCMGVDIMVEGWFVLIGYYLILKIFQVVLCFEIYDFNIDVVDIMSELWLFGFNYYIKGDDLKFLFSYLFGDFVGLFFD